MEDGFEMATLQFGLMRTPHPETNSERQATCLNRQFKKVSIMNKLLNLISVLAILFLAGCVTSYQSIEDIPERKRPAYEVTYNYMSCSMNSMNSLVALVGTGPAGNAGSISEETMQILADKACDTCDKELDAYSQFLFEKTQMQDLADKEALKLREWTNEKLMSMLEDSRKTE